MDENNNNFLDKNTLLAIGLSILFFMGWQWYVQKKYPETHKTAKQATSVHEPKGTQTEEAKTPANQVAEQSRAVEKQVVSQKLQTENDMFSGVISSEGMGFSTVELKEYSDRKEKNIVFTNEKLMVGNFGTRFRGKEVLFDLQKKDEKTFLGTANIDGVVFTKTMNLNPDNYTTDVELTVQGTTQVETIETVISNKALEVKSSFLTPAYEGTEFFVINDGSEERERVDIENKLNDEFEKSTLASIGSQYFAVALKDQSDIIPFVQTKYSPKNRIAAASVFHRVNPGETTKIKFTGFVGPKKYDILKKLDPEFVQMINYGIFSILSKPILSMLKWLYGLFQNWGLAIILLTVFIRVLLLPINISSLKSMKKMQKIQPQLKAIKEKYKSDPARVNQETMALMKKEKANPLGGCLPMLLQLPVFFALYSVLGQSVELYKSPFIFWINDLSYRDPLFILPIAVGALYFIQMSITPQPTDPTQAKMMKFIPLMFCFFMITVPSGLTLYFFVNTVFGIGQQLIFQREKRKAAA